MNNSILFQIIASAKIFGILLIHILLPSTNITSVSAASRVDNYRMINNSTLFILIATFVIDTMLNATLGSYAFAWLCCIYPAVTIKMISRRIYEPHLPALKFGSEIIWITGVAVAHVFVTHLLNGRIIYPTVTAVISTTVTVIIIMLLTRNNSI